MQDQFSRTKLLIGEEGLEKLNKSSIAVFGVGGVGGYTAEALARSGVGKITLIDNDKVCESNINRQIIATHKTINKYKTEAAAERIRDINPDCKVFEYNIFYMPETKDEISFKEYDYIVDAIDTVKGKLCIIQEAKAAGVPVISALGAGNKLDPTAFRIADIYETSVCPLARVMRRELKSRGIKQLKCVYSLEKPAKPLEYVQPDPHRRSVPGTISYAPAIAGLMIAGELIRDIIGM